jgi:uncharacterized protein (DUF305 family)
MKKFIIATLLLTSTFSTFAEEKVSIYKNEYIKEYQKVNDNMHSKMNVEYTGDPDVDFILGMIPHHQGALEMAKIQLKVGQDPEIRKLASNIIKAQKKEIKYMKDYLKSKGLEYKEENKSEHEGHH